MDILVKYADKNDAVKFLLEHLNSLGETLAVDGIFGKNTLKAVNKYFGNTTVVNLSSLVCNLKLKRTELDDFTAGELYINNELFCKTLEDKVRKKKIKGQTAIPYGKYKVIINYSNRFKRLMPRVLNVPNFDGILIHNAGEKKKGVDYTEGCILVCKDIVDGVCKDSKKVFDKLFLRLINYKQINLEIC